MLNIYTRYLLQNNRHCLFRSSFTKYKQPSWPTRLQTTTTTVGKEAAEPSAAQLRTVGKWLLYCSGGVVGAVILGGITRTTKSGLSMVDWHLFKEFPPLSHEKWIATFDTYKLFPEYKQQEEEMSLGEFKRIWWTEYIHRTYGRALGLFFALPAGYFWNMGWLNRPLKIRVVGIGTLIMAQGLLGWYMVKSGLEEKEGPARVSQYRLTAHLGGAFILYTLCLWTGLSNLLPPQKMEVTQKLLKFRRLAHGTKGLIFLTALSGGLVAGIQAGLVYNSFPKMGDSWIPSDILALTPTWVNFFENTTTVQFTHRLLAETTFFTVMGLWAYSRKLPLSPRARMAANVMAALACAQVGLGVSTLLLYADKVISTVHQSGALALLTSAIWLTHELKLLRRIPK